MKIDWSQFATCVSSMLAGLFWMWSATAVLPRFNDRMTEPPELERMTPQSRWNAAASICAALAAAAQAISFLGTLSGPN